jgi:hypothetical protein
LEVTQLTGDPGRIDPGQPVSAETDCAVRGNPAVSRCREALESVRADSNNSVKGILYSTISAIFCTIGAISSTMDADQASCRATLLLSGIEKASANQPLTSSLSQNACNRPV